MFAPARRENTFTMTSIAGPSNSGKTYSALLYARGLAGPDGKIALIDTENKRSRFYADVFEFDVSDLRPPFTSQRYIEKIVEAEKAEFPVCIVDSVSHEWEGTGGCLEQADAIQLRTKKPGLHCWKKPKAGHKKLVNTILQARMHLIFCCRVKEVLKPSKDKDGRSVIVNEGFAAIQEKGFIYEMTLSMLLDAKTHIPEITKCIEGLDHVFPKGELITTATGEAVRKWAEQGDVIDEKLEKLFDVARSAANLGTEKFKKWFKDESPENRRALKSHVMAELESICRAADETEAELAEAAALAEGEVETMDLTDALPAGVQTASELFPEKEDAD